MNLNNWITYAIPMLSLFISFYSIWRTRKNITVNFSPNVIALPFDSIHTLDESGERDFHYHKALLTYVEIVNSSLINISYFDLRVFDDDCTIPPEKPVKEPWQTKHLVDTLPSLSDQVKKALLLQGEDRLEADKELTNQLGILNKNGNIEID